MGDKDIFGYDSEVIRVLGSSAKDMSITELVVASNFSRSAIRTALARLEGAGKVSFRQVGMAKLYSVNN